ncbi:MAG: RNA-binding protein [Candidatus Competibacteraceae bacterium]|nr:RNA-binding protein [Candidatus Competibacteraceae bacterium]MCB1807236.1 RNA-binding protein [Candidatus Competibacteraceae bacterium]MCB1812743.1 RNA-binding protein [Candidatus Competibacteraceae bacterium]
MNIYVGNLAYSVTEDELQTLFAAHGSVSSVSLIKDKYTNQSKGFGFVEMDKQAEAEEAIKQLNGHSVGGRNITVNIARPRGERPKSRPRW